MTFCIPTQQNNYIWAKKPVPTSFCGLEELEFDGLLLQDDCLWIAFTHLHLQGPPSWLAFCPLRLHLGKKCHGPWFIASSHAQLIWHREAVTTFWNKHADVQKEDIIIQVVSKWPQMRSPMFNRPHLLCPAPTGSLIQEKWNGDGLVCVNKDEKSRLVQIGSSFKEPQPDYTFILG